MRQTSSDGGTKIAQAAKELNVTSVTIRRYIAEFNIETTTDENGVKVLPANAMDELQEIRRLKEEGLTNPKVMEHLEQRRAKLAAEGKGKDREKAKAYARADKKAPAAEKEAGEKVREAPARRRQPKAEPAEPAAAEPAEPEEEEEGEIIPPAVAELAVSARAKHALTCQTCGKSFEHMNPRLRDCLDCYRAKRRERRRGSSERHKNVIQHPLAQQAASKTAPVQTAIPAVPVQAPVIKQAPVRNYRKAIEETRQITSNLKRRLERPDLSEGERRWLEQIYAYQLILHQGWRHLAEYKSGTQQISKPE